MEAAGNATQYAGYSLVLRGVRAENRALVMDRKVGVMADGHLTFSIPAYSLENGTYVFVLSVPSDLKHALAAGVFKISSPGASAKDTPSSGSTNSNTAALAGHWYGIAGTVADLKLFADGSYISADSAKGTWRRAGNTVVFTGPLSAWNGGRGQLNAKGDVIEFQWTTASGAKQYFVIGKY